MGFVLVRAFRLQSLKQTINHSEHVHRPDMLMYWPISCKWGLSISHSRRRGDGIREIPVALVNECLTSS